MRKLLKHIFIIYFVFFVCSCIGKDRKIPPRSSDNIINNSYECLNDTSEYYIITFYPYGNLRSTGYISGMKKDLIWREYNDDGEICKEELFVKGSLYLKDKDSIK